MKIHKGEREMHKMLWNEGIRVSASHRNGNNHLCLIVPGIRGVYRMSSTPSDSRARRNILSDIRRMVGR